MRNTINRFIALVLVLSSLLIATPQQVFATTTMPCLALDQKTVIIGDSNTVVLKNKCSDINDATIFARVSATVGECVNNWNYILPDYNKTMKQLIDALSGDDFHTVVINMGTNHLGGNMTTYRTYYQTLLDNLYAKNPDARIYICKILPVNHSLCTGKYAYLLTNQNVNKVNNVVAALYEENAATGRDIRLIDYNTPFKDASGNLSNTYGSGDGVHLNAAGAKKMNTILQTRLAQDSPYSNHTWTVVSQTEATCTSDGATVKKCSHCGKQITETIPASGHTWTVYTVLDTMTEDGHYNAEYKCSKCGATKTAPYCCSESFVDAEPKGHWAHLAIDWAVYNGIAIGTSNTTFSPHAACERAQVVTMLYRFFNSPDVEVTSNHVFNDVDENSYYYKPVLWAAENDITFGTEHNQFRPHSKCTRCQIVTFLWRASDCPEPVTDNNPFSDVKESRYYYKAVLWAYENGITIGTSESTFSPNSICTREQVVTFLYRTVNHFN